MKSHVGFVILTLRMTSDMVHYQSSAPSNVPAIKSPMETGKVWPDHVARGAAVAVFA